MYEEMRKPKLLKDVPLPLLRALPVIYYANKYAADAIPQIVNNLYQSHLDYLCLVLHTIAEQIYQPAFTELPDRFRLAGSPPAPSNLTAVQQLGTSLAHLCSDHKTDIKTQYQTIRARCSEIFKQKITPIRILLVDNKKDEEALKKVMTILRTFCHYRTEYLSPTDQDADMIYTTADFVIFFSTASAYIHDQVRMLKTAGKPGLALVRFDDVKIADQTSIRLGRQLMKSGFPVLFNVFTPIRLFTSIDKTYIRHHLC